MKIGIALLCLLATINSVLIKNRLYSVLNDNKEEQMKFNEKKEIRFIEKSNNEVIIRQGWLKYLEINEDDNIKNARFRKNPLYNNQHNIRHEVRTVELQTIEKQLQEKISENITKAFERLKQ